MSSGFEAAGIAIRSLVGTAVGAGNAPVYHDAVPVNASADHVLLRVAHGGSFPTSTGRSSGRRFAGVVTARCRATNRKGAAAAEALADAVDAVYSRANFEAGGDKFLFLDGGEVHRGEDGAFFEIALEYPFERDVTA